MLSEKPVSEGAWFQTVGAATQAEELSFYTTHRKCLVADFTSCPRHIEGQRSDWTKTAYCLLPGLPDSAVPVWTGASLLGRWLLSCFWQHPTLTAVSGRSDLRGATNTQQLRWQNFCSRRTPPVELSSSPNYAIRTSPTDCSDDSCRHTFFGKHEHHAALWLWYAAPYKNTYLLTYIYLLTVTEEDSGGRPMPTGLQTWPLRRGLPLWTGSAHVKAAMNGAISTVLWCAVSTVRLSNSCIKVKVMVFRTRYRALGPELIPMYRQSARRWP